WWRCGRWWRNLNHAHPFRSLARLRVPAVLDQIGRQRHDEDYGGDRELYFMATEERIILIVVIVVIKCRPRPNRGRRLDTRRPSFSNRAGTLLRGDRRTRFRDRLERLWRLQGFNRIRSVQLVIHGISRYWLSRTWRFGGETDLRNPHTPDHIEHIHDALVLRRSEERRV